MRPLAVPATRARSDPAAALARLRRHELRHRTAHVSGTGGVSRRQFLTTAGVGTAAVAATLSLPRFAFASGGALPNPIPGGLETPFGLIHIYLPGFPPFGSPDPATNDPAVVTDFNGHVGLAYVQGMGTRTDKATGQMQHLPFEVDLRFMKGEYVGVDGRHYNGAFALI